MTEMPTPQPETPPPPIITGGQAPAPLQSQKTRWTLFAAGFVFFFLANGLSLAISIFSRNLIPDMNSFINAAISLSGTLCFVFDLLLIIVLTLIPKTRWFAFGFLAAMGVSFLLTLLAGVIFMVYCFYTLSNPS
jgi:hypothetical protein